MTMCLSLAGSVVAGIAVTIATAPAETEAIGGGGESCDRGGTESPTPLIPIEALAGAYLPGPPAGLA